MTTNHMGVKSLTNDPISTLIARLPFGYNALHDIHLRFKVNHIWTRLSPNSALKVEPVSKDLRLPTLKIRDLEIKITIHKSDTVSVVVGCSYAPVATDCWGIIRLSNALTRVEERLSRLVKISNSSGTEGEASCSCGGPPLLIPEHSQWFVTMWHFGKDSLTEYSGEKFSTSWEVGQNALIRVYAKDMKEHGTKIRIERQEYPGKTFDAAVVETLGGGHK